MTASAARRIRHRVLSGAVVVTLAVVNVLDHAVHPPWWVHALAGAGLLAAARLAGLTWSELGWARNRLGSGSRWGLGAIALVAGGYVVGVLLPLTRPAFQDERYHLPLPDAVYSAFIAIPLGTVLLEEVAFRSVLWGALARHCRPWQVLVTTSVLFGLWHVLTAAQASGRTGGLTGAAGGAGSPLLVGGTVLVTTVGGLVFGAMRQRSASVLASAAAHWATNGLGVLLGLLAWRLSR